ncbi:hypothetical protein K0M31_007850, partial [Melipona bicolor]
MLEARSEFNDVCLPPWTGIDFDDARYFWRTKNTTRWLQIGLLGVAFLARGWPVAALFLGCCYDEQSNGQLSCDGKA